MKGLYLCLLLLLSLVSYSQTRNSIDSTSILVEQASTTDEKIKILNNASARLKDSDLKSSFSYASQAFHLATEANDSLGLIDALLNLGRYYTRLGRHEIAMENYFKALNYAEQIKDDPLINRIYNIIGNGYYFKKDIPLALKYYKKALAVNSSSISDEAVADLQNNVALVYMEQGKLDSAGLYLSSASKKYEPLQLPKKLANTLMNWGEVKERMFQYEQAISFYQQSLKINQSMGTKLQEGVVLAQICSVLIQLKDFKEAERNGKQALAIGLDENFQPLIINAYENLYKLSKEKNNFAEALSYHEKLLTAKAALFDTEQNHQMEELRTKYETEQKEKENQELLKDAEQTEKQLLFVRLLLGLSLVFAIVVSILAYIYYKSLVENKKAKADLLMLNHQIQEQKEELTVQAEDLVLANNEITSINDNLEKLVEEKTSEIIKQNERLIKYAFQNAHNVRGPLARIMGLVNLVKMNAANKEEIPFLLSEIEKASHELDSVIKEINNTLEDSTEQ